MKWRPSIRLVMPLCMVGVALMVMVIVCVIYSTTATTMFSQLGMSNTLQAMDQVSKRLSDSIGQVEDVLREVADGMEDRGGADSRQFDSSLRLSAGAMENLSALLLLDEYGNPVLGLPSAESKKTCRISLGGVGHTQGALLAGRSSPYRHPDGGYASGTVGGHLPQRDAGG